MPLEYRCNVSCRVVTRDMMISFCVCLAIPDDGLKQPENMEQDDADKNPDQRITRQLLHVPCLKPDTCTAQFICVVFILELSADKNIQRGNEFYDNEEEGDRNVTLHREATPPKRARSKSPRPQSTNYAGISVIYSNILQHTPHEGLHCHLNQAQSPQQEIITQSNNKVGK